MAQGARERTRNQVLLVAALAVLVAAFLAVAAERHGFFDLRVYFGARGFANVTLGVCRGKKLHDKRETIKRREVQRELRGG